MMLFQKLLLILHRVLPRQNEGVKNGLSTWPTEGKWLWRRFVQYPAQPISRGTKCDWQSTTAWGYNGGMPLSACIGVTCLGMQCTEITVAANQRQDTGNHPADIMALRSVRSPADHPLSTVPWGFVPGYQLHSGQEVSRKAPGLALPLRAIHISSTHTPTSKTKQGFGIVCKSTQVTS